jgi:hypothetical protein
MIDIETLGVKNNAPVLSAGWCWFNYDKPDIEPTGKGQIGFDVEEQVKHYGRIIMPDTVKWWFGQSDSARGAVFPQNPGSFPAFIPQLTKLLDAADTVWAKGPDFDCNILASLVDACGHVYKWPYWKHRCVRTMLQQFPAFHAHVKMEGTAHNALADAIHQANQIRAIASALGNGE